MIELGLTATLQLWLYWAAPERAAGYKKSTFEFIWYVNVPKC